jgi:hypothetical protein
MGCWGGKFEFRQMLKTTREHCKKLMQVSIDSEINSNIDYLLYIVTYKKSDFIVSNIVCLVSIVTYKKSDFIVSNIVCLVSLVTYSFINKSDAFVSIIVYLVSMVTYSFIEKVMPLSPLLFI